MYFYKAFVFLFVLGSDIIGFCLALNEKEVTEVLQTSFDCHSNPALAVAVVKDGKILYSHGFGYTTLDKKSPVTDETLFVTASISKSFAAALLVKQLHQTKYTINSKVREFLGDDFKLGDKLRTKETTFLDLLSHKTAIVRNNAVRFNPNVTRDDLLRKIHLLPATKQFRVDYIYNSLIYALVGRISEILGGHAQNNKRWEDLISENFFEPLGMSKSTFSTRIDYSREDLATGYHHHRLNGSDIFTKNTPESLRKWGEMCASGSIISSAKDMANWLNFHISEGKNISGHQVMDQNLVQELHQPRFAIESTRYMAIERSTFPITVTDHAYAMGLKVGHYRGYPLLVHSGSTFGYKSYMTMLPSEKIGAIVLITGQDLEYRHRAPVTHYLLDRALGIEPYINSTTICTFPKPWADDNQTTADRPGRSKESLDFNIGEYKGIYTDIFFGNLEISYNSTLQSLVMKYGWGEWELILWPSANKEDNSEQRFYAAESGINSVFDMSPLYFIEHPHKTGTVVGFRATAFERERPPIFCKEEHQDICEKIIAKSYPEEEAQLCDSSVSVQFAYGKFYVFVLLVFAKSVNDNWSLPSSSS